MTPTCAEERAVLQSVIYASLFDYPLTLAQLRESLVEVAADEASIAAWCRTSALLQATVEYRDHLYFPAGRGDLVETRARREALSRELLHRHSPVLQFVAHMPFVRMVALSGSLAHLNADPAADVDLFVITAAKRVWLVTVAVLLVAKVLGWRRRLCLNYVISERQMAITPTDLFTANQIIHLLPLAGHSTYRRFLNANAFVSRWYPNFVPRDQGSGIGDRGSGIRDRSRSSGCCPMALLRSPSGCAVPCIAGTCGGGRRAGSRAIRCGWRMSASSCIPAVIGQRRWRGLRRRWLEPRCDLQGLERG